MGTSRCFCLQGIKSNITRTSYSLRSPQGIKLPLKNEQALAFLTVFPTLSSGPAQYLPQGTEQGSLLIDLTEQTVSVGQ